MRTFPHIRIKKAHTHSIRNYDEIMASEECGCFYCLEIFKPDEIDDWLASEKTACCPRCSIDSIIGSASGYPITKAFLQRMHEYWFSTSTGGTMDLTEDLIRLAKEYQAKGMIDSKLLLTVEDALNLLRDLASRDILMLGYDGWRYADKDKGTVYQVAGYSVEVEEFVPYLEVTPAQAAQILEGQLSKGLPPDIDLVSVYIDDRDVADLFKMP